MGSKSVVLEGFVSVWVGFFKLFLFACLLFLFVCVSLCFSLIRQLSESADSCLIENPWGDLIH